MKRWGLIAAVTGLLVLFLGIVLLVQALSSSGKKDTIAAPASTTASQAIQTTPTPQPSPSAEEKLPEKIAKPENFSDGIWIRKYPEDNASFKFETPDGIKIVGDPYDMDETVAPDIVTESHQHEDHTDVSKLTGPYKLFTAPGNWEVKGVKVTGYPGKHNKGDTGLTNTMFVYEIHGIRIAHLASQGEVPEDSVLEALKGVDVLLIQGSSRIEYANSKMTVTECCSVIQKLNPKIVIPEHGTPGLAGSLAGYLNLTPEHEKDGQLVVTKAQMAAQKEIRIIDLDT